MWKNVLAPLVTPVTLVSNVLQVFTEWSRVSTDGSVWLVTVMAALMTVTLPLESAGTAGITLLVPTAASVLWDSLETHVLVVASHVHVLLLPHQTSSVVPATLVSLERLFVQHVLKATPGSGVRDVLTGTRATL